jgi:preprotein translocase subunit SecA
MAAGAAVRNVRASLGDQPLTQGGGNGSATPGGARPGYTPTGERIGRNDPCWCGSGAKYKKCHGR